MPKRPLIPCRHPGCAALLERPGHCATHAADANPNKNFEALNAKKTDESKAFYASMRWTKASIRHRQKEPLCRRCRAAGRVVPAQMVHHNPPRETLIARGESLYDDAFLESLCNNCHLGELRGMKKTPASRHQPGNFPLAMPAMT